MLIFVPFKKAERRILAHSRLGNCVKRAVALLLETGAAQQNPRPRAHTVQHCHRQAYILKGLFSRVKGAQKLGQRNYLPQSGTPRPQAHTVPHFPQDEKGY